jgi:ectoine hydroxylase-related dioxygenase (phytanoyl-CoA dioxygenase family)
MVETDNSSIMIAVHSDKSVVKEARSLIESLPKNSTEIDAEEWREMVWTIQNQFCEAQLGAKVCKNTAKDLVEYMGTDKILIQSNVYFRATRPVSEETPIDMECIGFHRETFYGPNMEQSVNVWTPIKGVTEQNTLRYIENSQLIDDAEIVTQSKPSEYTEKGSTGHKLGLLYAPKEIVEGVTLDCHLPLNVPNFSTAYFSGNLIHGAAINRSLDVRYSFDFRILRKSDYRRAKNKQFHISTGKPYFIEVDL